MRAECWRQSLLTMIRQCEEVARGRMNDGRGGTCGTLLGLMSGTGRASNSTLRLVEHASRVSCTAWDRLCAPPMTSAASRSTTHAGEPRDGQADLFGDRLAGRVRRGRTGQVRLGGAG